MLRLMRSPLPLLVSPRESESSPRGRALRVTMSPSVGQSKDSFVSLAGFDKSFSSSFVYTDADEGWGLLLGKLALSYLCSKGNRDVAQAILTQTTPQPSSNDALDQIVLGTSVVVGLAGATEVLLAVADMPKVPLLTGLLGVTLIDSTINPMVWSHARKYALHYGSAPSTISRLSNPLREEELLAQALNSGLIPNVNVSLAGFGTFDWEHGSTSESREALGLMAASWLLKYVCERHIHDLLRSKPFDGVEALQTYLEFVHSPLGSLLTWKDALQVRKDSVLFGRVRLLANSYAMSEHAALKVIGGSAVAHLSLRTILNGGNPFEVKRAFCPTNGFSGVFDTSAAFLLGFGLDTFVGDVTSAIHRDGYGVKRALIKSVLDTLIEPGLHVVGLSSPMAKKNVGQMIRQNTLFKIGSIALGWLGGKIARKFKPRPPPQNPLQHVASFVTRGIRQLHNQN